MTYTIGNYYPEHDGHPAFDGLEEFATVSDALAFAEERAKIHGLDITHFRITEWDAIDGEAEIIRSMCAEQYLREMRFPIADGREMVAMVPEDLFTPPCECRPLPVGDGDLAVLMVSGEGDCPLHGFGAGRVNQ